MEPTTKKHALSNLADSTLTRYRPQFSYRVALARGAIVDISSWTSRDCNFGKPGVTVRVAVTTRLWNRVVKSSLRLKYYDALYGKDHDVVHLAARALEQARRLGLDAANFHVHLATAGNCDEMEQVIRVEYQELDETSGYVVIGFPDECASL